MAYDGAKPAQTQTVSAAMQSILDNFEAIDGSDGAITAVKINQTGATASLTVQDGGSTVLLVSDGGWVTKPLQPAFLVQPASTQSNIAVGSAVTVVFGTEHFDVNSDFASNVFTAPVTGKYHFDVHIYAQQWDSVATVVYDIALVTTARTYIFSFVGNDYASDMNKSFGFSILADMTTADTAYVAITQTNGTQQTDIGTGSWFSGYLVA